ncbi:hypothetical protein [Paenibacillus aestuarii]|uniref:Uncharacterized protein n=1 Tax=Paenibacillus aestuarii TaxID=516965 RepID=A0ABW0K3E4_9BACL|nr:hypothetical protein [Paenibacillus aestuarii]
MRRTRALLSQFSTNQLHLRNPWVVTFFAFSYPGFGNLILHRYAKALILILWELFINHQAKINLAIMYTMQGHFQSAKEVIDERWFILYVGIYMFAIWDAYRSTVDINKQYMLADREDAPMITLKMGVWDMNYLDKKLPWVALAWSALVPGLGYLYIHKVISGLFMFGYTTAIVYFSHLPQAIHWMMIGHFEQSKSVINMQWLLYLPSIYTFIFYDSYISTVEQNKLFEKEQSKYLRMYYQASANVEAIFQSAQVKSMKFIVATFEQTVFLEMAITAVERLGITKDKITALPLDKRSEPRKIFDSIHTADGFSMMDLAAVLGTIFMLLGAIYGFELKWGPILWGIIGAVSGILLGFSIKLMILKKNRTGVKGITSEVVVMIQCEEALLEKVEEVLWDHTALGVSRMA